MGTKCNVIVRDEKYEDEKYLYGHCDGAPADAGAAVLKAVYAFAFEKPDPNPTTEDVVEWIDSRADGMLRRTEELHNDAEYTYAVTIHKEGNPQVRMQAFTSTPENPKSKDATVDVFVALVEVEASKMVDNFIRHLSEQFYPFIDRTKSTQDQAQVQNTERPSEEPVQEKQATSTTEVKQGVEPWSGE